MPEPLILLIGLAVAGAVALAPLLRRRPGALDPGDEREAAALRHRVALEALRDVETDRRAGSLDDDAYARQLAEAEERAAATRAALDDPAVVPDAHPGRRYGRVAACVLAGGIGTVLVLGSLLPATGIGNQAVVNQQLADQQAAEASRQARIAELNGRLAADSRDPESLSALADAHLAGSEPDDLVAAAVALQVLIQLEPERADAYERIMGAYLRAGDAANARAAHDSYASLDSPDAVEVAFYDGLIALLLESDTERALTAFDQFLELAPGDPRVEMIRGLREDAAADQ